MQPAFPEVFDSSMLAAYKACPELFRKTYLHHWKPKELSVHLHAGKSYAHGIEVTRRAFYEQEMSAPDAIATGLQALLTAYGPYECPADSAKSAERMAGAFVFYWENYPLDHDEAPIILPGGKRGIEFSFVHPVGVLHPQTGQPLLYCGRMDAILHFAGGKFITDEKTTSRLGSTWSQQWDLRSQFTGYAWGCRESGIQVNGALIRGVSILKTKYETQQAVSYRPDWQISRWYAELLLWLNDIIRSWETGHWRHNFDHACTDFGGCAFTRPCQSQEEEPWLETAFERRSWNPITREEIKL